MYVEYSYDSDLLSLLVSVMHLCMNVWMYVCRLSFNPAAADTTSAQNNSGAAVVSILVSKNAGRYRVQADSYPALYVVLAGLVPLDKYVCMYVCMANYLLLSRAWTAIGGQSQRHTQ